MRFFAPHRWLNSANTGLYLGLTASLIGGCSNTWSDPMASPSVGEDPVAALVEMDSKPNDSNDDEGQWTDEDSQEDTGEIPEPSDTDLDGDADTDTDTDADADADADADTNADTNTDTDTDRCAQKNGGCGCGSKDGGEAALLFMPLWLMRRRPWT